MSDNKVVKHEIDLGVIDRTWEFSKNPREEGLLKLLKYVKWNTVEGEEAEKYFKEQRPLEIKKTKSNQKDDKFKNLVMQDICKKLNHCNISIDEFNKYYENKKH